MTESSKEKWDNEGREYKQRRGENTAGMDEHTRSPKVEMGKESSHPYKRR